MANMNISNLPEVTSPLNDDLLLLNRGGVDYKVTQSNLLTNVNSNITSLTSNVNTLQSQQALLEERLLQYYSPIYAGETLLGPSSIIHENDDLNNYINPGVYYCQSNVIGNTIINRPPDVNASGTLIVRATFGQDIDHTGPWQYMQQWLFAFGGGIPMVFVRNFSSASTPGAYSWTYWIVQTPRYGEYTSALDAFDPGRICGQIANKWIYMKVVKYIPTAAIGSTTQVTAVNIPHGLPSDAVVVGLEAMAVNANGGSYAIPNALSSAASGATVDYPNRANGVYGIDGNNLQFRITKDNWGTNYTFYFYIKYMKK